MELVASLRFFKYNRYFCPANSNVDADKYEQKTRSRMENDHSFVSSLSWHHFGFAQRLAYLSLLSQM